LYTSLDLIDKKTLDKLYNAGLDEIRFHLDFKDHKLWNKLELALDYKWDVGVEIPAIPKNKNDIKKIILNLNGLNKKFKKKLFLNLNELEIADNKVNKLLKLGYKPKNELSYAVNGSEELALNLLNFVEKNRLEINVHYCTATLKDKVQLANRIKRRAKNIAKAYDKITQDGTLIRGSIYLSSLKPGFKYREKIKKIVNNTKLKNKYLAELKIIKDNIKKDFKVKNIEVDKNKLRILTSVKEVKKIRDIIDKNLLKNITKDKKLLKNKDLSLAIVEEYPTYDQIELNVEFL